MKGKILIADDESKMRLLVSDFLEDEGYEVLQAKDGEIALDLIYKNPDIQLIILDIMMPKVDGFEVAEEIKDLMSIPILMLTARTAEKDELRGFKLGIDDYIRKPFSPGVLVARVNALFTRVYGNSTVIEKGMLTFLLDNHTVLLNNEPLNFSQREFSLLYYLAENNGIILSREQIIYKVWGYDYQGTDRTIDTHMNRIRIKLGDASKYVMTVRGLGYKFEVIE